MGEVITVSRKEFPFVLQAGTWIVWPHEKVRKRRKHWKVPEVGVERLKLRRVTIKQLELFP